MLLLSPNVSNPLLRRKSLINDVAIRLPTTLQRDFEATFTYASTLLCPSHFCHRMSLSYLLLATPLKLSTPIARIPKRQRLR